MGVETIALATLAAGAIGGGAQILQARKQEKAVRKGEKRQSQAAATAEREERKREEQASLLTRKRRGAAGAGEGRARADILTSPLNIGAQGAATGGKTLLGA